MNERNNPLSDSRMIPTKLTVACPQGHRVRGGVRLVGKSVKCPKCAEAFVFAPTGLQTNVNEINRLNSPKNPERSKKESPSNHSVTESSVMRILGDATELPPPPEKKSGKAMRPCSRCNVSIAQSLTVCPHCDCYVSAMPTFFKNMN